MRGSRPFILYNAAPVLRRNLLTASLLTLVAATAVTPAVGAATAGAAEQEATSAADVARIAPQLKPGDTVVLLNGVWTDQQLELDVSGTADRPITIRAQTPGKVKLTGTSSLTLAGRHVVATGLLFKDVAGDEATIEVTGSKCRVTQCAVDGGTSRTFVHLSGPDNRLDHCYVAGKTSDAPTLQVEAPADVPQGGNRIDHNHFGPRPPLKRNGGETIRVGYSHQQETVSRTVCEFNLFDRCDGEIEIISNKSCENVYRNNTFVECVGMLTMRHGDRCVIDGNIFLGRGKQGSGGIRLCGEGHVVTNNYIDGVDAGAFRLTTGANDPQPKDHRQARNCVLAYNTAVDCGGTYVYASIGYSAPNRTRRPEQITFANNLFDLGKRGVLIEGPEGKDNRWIGNLVAGGDDDGHVKERGGLRRVDLKMRNADDGLWRPAPDSPARGAAVADASLPTVAHDVDGQARGTTTTHDVGADQLSDAPVKFRPLTAADVGPSWMGKRTLDGAQDPDPAPIKAQR
jgi:poly(beta-D-mannuronate) lyase